MTSKPNLRETDMAKRGRPRKADGWRPADADAYAIKALQAKIGKLTEERDDHQKLAEDRFIMSQTLAKQLVDAEKRMTELLAEIRMYEHETSTLRHIIIDGLRGYDR